MLYATEARKAIVAILRNERRFLSVADIHARLRQKQPSIALSTVYRTLELLTELGTVSRRSAGKGSEYVFCGEVHHHHAVCRDCGRVEDVECRAMDGVRRELLERSSFILDDHELTFFGRCDRCRAAPEHS